MLVDPLTVHFDMLRAAYPELATNRAAMERANYGHRWALANNIPVGSENYWKVIKWSQGYGDGEAYRPPLSAEQEKLADELKLDHDTMAAKVAEFNDLKAQGHYRRDRG
jgi:hypothetical protein